LKLRSVLAVPLIARGEVLGVVYLDDRMRAGAFGKRELGWVRLVSALAAVAVADARDQLLLRRAARRARSAEAKVTQMLAKREALLLLANQALARTRGRQTRFDYDAIVGESAPIQDLLNLVDRVVPSDIPVLVLGSSGSGKELIARAIHSNGPRREMPFVSENCSAIPESLLESTLFGHVKGAFTGAARHHAGLFEIAHGGTLFLDEIADMSLGMQAKLLRVLENGEMRRVGSERSIKVDVRVIGATHKSLEQMVQARTFREDLYYRLNVITLRVPALAERRADIPLLVRHFLNKYASDRRIVLAPGVLDELCSLPWPGNVRQLENEMRRALVLADDEIRQEHLSSSLIASNAAPEAALNLRARLDALETQLVQRALSQTQGNQTKAALLLGVSRFGLQKMIRRLEIDLPQARADED
jgi:transcriptional regulator with GAF, ATPase, and Fis domain